MFPKICKPKIGVSMQQNGFDDEVNESYSDTLKNDPQLAGADSPSKNSPAEIAAALMNPNES